MTHAGAVGRDGRGVLLVGRGGSGKSTLALSCAIAGMEIVADDYVLLEPDSLTAHAMQSTAKLTEDSAERLGVSAAAIDPAGFEPTLEGSAKALVDIRAIAPGTLVRRLEVRAIIAPTLSLHGPAHIAGGRGLDRMSRRSGRSRRPRDCGRWRRARSCSRGSAARRSLAALAELVRRVPELRAGAEPRSGGQRRGGRPPGGRAWLSRRVTAAIPVRDGEAYLAEAIESVLGPEPPLRAGGRRRQRLDRPQR